MGFVHHLVIVTVMICEASAKNFCDGKNEEKYFCKYKGETYSRLCPRVTRACRSIGEIICICKEGYFRRQFWAPCVTWRECVVPNPSSLQILRTSEPLLLTKASGNVLYTRLVKCFKSYRIADNSGKIRSVSFLQRSGTISIPEVDPIAKPAEDHREDKPTTEVTPQDNSGESPSASATNDELFSCVWCPALRTLDTNSERAQMSNDRSINSRSLVQTDLETVPRSVRQRVKARSDFFEVHETFSPWERVKLTLSLVHRDHRRPAIRLHPFSES
ncbi:uncharacterized protein LOC142563371 [Dermacentor variabilis]|uniref:uncharacterized protein LOC142563371 n=1 Tax=Dermacentor variabilis TaxID=34621 RepID=UPI003F5C3801